MRSAERQAGVALVTALVVVAIAVVIASAMLWQSQLAQRRSGNIQFQEQGWQYLRGAEDWAGHILRRDAEQDEDSDHLGEAWAQPLAGLPVTDEAGTTIGELSGRLEDLQGRFNLNNLAFSSGEALERQRNRFRNLLNALEITEPIEYAVQDWVDPDQEPSGLSGAEDGAYLRRTPAYRAANRPMQSVTELRLVAGVSPEIYARLAPHVTALPAFTPINVNTASLPVLLSLADVCDPGTLPELAESRLEQPFRQPQEFLDACGAEAGRDGGPPAGELAVQSGFFMLHGELAIGSLRLSLYSLLLRDTASGATRTIARATGDF